MAKLTDDKIIEHLDTLDVDAQISLYHKIQAVVTTNVLAHQKELENNASKYQSIADKIKGNQA